MILAPALASEAPALAALHALAFATPWNASEIADLLGGAGAFALTVGEGAILAGFILCRTMADEAEILTLAVAPDRRGRGIGRCLLEAATAIAKTRGAAALFLEVAADNASAVALYEGAGFRRVGLRAGYYAMTEGAVDGLVFRLDLAG